MVTLTNTNRGDGPATVTIPAGASSQTFTVSTSTVTTNEVGSVTASYGGVSQSLAVTVRPIRVSTLTLAPNPVTGGANASARRARVRRARRRAVVTLSSSNASVAAPTVSSVTIPAGAKTGSFTRADVAGGGEHQREHLRDGVRGEEERRADSRP